MTARTRTWRRSRDPEYDWASNDGLVAFRRGELNGWELHALDARLGGPWVEGDTLREVKAWADEHWPYPYRAP